MLQRYIVEGMLDHDRVIYKTGDTLTLEDAQAEPLLAIGRVKPAAEDITPPANQEQPAAPAQEMVAEKPETDTTKEQMTNEEIPTEAPRIRPEQPAAPAAPSEQPTPEEVEATAKEVQ